MTDTLTRRPFVSALAPSSEQTVPGYWFVFRNSQLLLEETEAGARVPYTDTVALPLLHTHYLGEYDGIPCYAAELENNAELPADLAFHRLRSLMGRLDEDLFWIAGRAVQIVDWDRTHQFCGVCASPMELSSNERVKVCSNAACSHSNYPRLAPAVIMAVTRGNRLLLARSHRHPPGLYSVLAGFVEPGETLEECVMREVKEEVGIDVQNVRYFGSQPWPFPNSLMIAFTCEYAAGELVLEESEMAAADWFLADSLPQIPPPITISRGLIDWFVAGQEHKGGV